MAIEIQAPGTYQQLEQVKVFLGGSIEMGLAEAWQQRVVSALTDLNVVILNPRRANWDNSLKQDITDPQFCEQVNWELQALDDANIVVIYFDPQTKAPIALLEMGLHVREKGILVCCPEAFYRKGNVDVTCQKYKVPVFTDLGKMIAVLRHAIQTATITKTLAQPETQIAPDPADIMDSEDAPDLDEVRPTPSPVSDPEQSKREFQAYLKAANEMHEEVERKYHYTAKSGGTPRSTGVVMAANTVKAMAAIKQILTTTKKLKGRKLVVSFIGPERPVQNNTFNLDLASKVNESYQQCSSCGGYSILKKKLCARCLNSPKEL